MYKEEEEYVSLRGVQELNCACYYFRRAQSCTNRSKKLRLSSGLPRMCRASSRE